MSGETPPKDEQLETDGLHLGQTLYTDDGEPVGTIRGIGPGEITVTTREGVERLSIEHARAGHGFGEAEIMWRCLECGEMGYIEEELGKLRTSIPMQGIITKFEERIQTE